MGLLISLYGLVTTAFQPLMGALSDRLGVRKPMIRIGRRPLIVAGLLLLAPATGLLGLARSTAQLTRLRLVQAWRPQVSPRRPSRWWPTSRRRAGRAGR